MGSRCYAPIALFAFQRPAHFSTCWQTLAANSLSAKTEIYIFCDGPRTKQDFLGVKKVNQEAQKIKGFKSVKIISQTRNIGLSSSVIHGVTNLLGENQTVIVVEDDLEVSAYFLDYMNDALFAYQNHPAAASVHGYVYPCKENLPETFFMKGADCWGWATWRSAWKLFEPDGRRLLLQLQKRELEREFDLGGVAPFTEILKAQIAGQNDSWAIRWHASAFLAGLHTLYPGRSLVKNTGFDSSGTHCGTSQHYNSELSRTPIRVEPIPVVESEIGRKAFEEFFKAQR